MEMNSKTAIEPRGNADPAPDRAGRITSRRQFLKGTSLALPAVMTLHSGAAQAITSITCGAKALASGQSASCVITGDDGFLRQTVITYNGTKLNRKNQRVPLQPAVATYFAGQESVGGTLVPCYRDFHGNKVTDTTLVDTTTTCGTRRAIVHIDATNGGIRAVGASTPPSNCIVTSAAGLCMASLAAHGG